MAHDDEPPRRPLFGVLLFCLGLLLAASFLSSPPWTGSGPALGLPREACGTVGVAASHYLLGALGPPLAVWLLAVVFGLASRALLRRPRRPWLFQLWGGSFAFALSVLAGTLRGGDRWGTLPVDAAAELRSPGLLGPVGAGLAAGGVVLLLAVVGLLRWVPRRARAAAERVAAASGAAIRSGLRPRSRSEAATIASADRSAGGLTGRTASPLDGAGPLFAATEGPARAEGASAGPERAGGFARLARGADRPGREEQPVLESVEKRNREARGSRAARPETPGPWVLPPVDLLERGEPPIPIDREELAETGRTLVRTLADFGITGQLGQVHPGPVVTQYEFEPAAGVKVAQIVSRSEDLALALRASRIRLVAPIPGKAAVGVEVPNRSAATIHLRSILDEIDLGSLPGELPLVLGRDIRGRAYAARLEQMPHLLVAGTTGSGKSVFLNAALLSLLLRRTPADLRLLLIDPKMLELTPYDGIPHLVCPVVTESKQAARMLTWSVGEMERRYRRLAALGVRNLEGYRERARGARESLEPMPHLVIVVDELADLMLTLAAEIEGPIARLAQMARAVGIHLLLATQRPSVDVITGVIKANFPARIAFQVASRVDSRTILDGNGAESLLGRGDMLFVPPGKAEAVRVHGAFVGERDAAAVAEFLRAQPPAPPIYQENEAGQGGGDPDLDDELFEDALRLIVQTRQASTSFLQRRLKVGYSRAGRLIDLLERAGAVGPPDGSKSREVLADDAFLERRRHREPRDESRQAV